MDIKLYPGIAFSPQAELADNIGAADTIIKVTDISVFPDAPNLATIGTDEEGETILYAAKTADALSGCVRGVEGTARAWSAGELIGRNWTAKDHNDLISAVLAALAAASEARTAADNAQTAAGNAQNAAAAVSTALGEHGTTPDAHSELFAALEAKYRRHVIAVRMRDPSKPSYGLGGGDAVAMLEVGPYTGGAEVTAIVSGVEYDAKNMSASGENVPDGTLILTKVEE